MWKGIAIGVGLVVESALCASAQTPDQSEETKRTLTQQFLDCVTSQVITIDDLTSDVAGIAHGAVSLCRAEAHAAAVSKAGSQNELVPNLHACLEASGIETGIAALLNDERKGRLRPIEGANIQGLTGFAYPTIIERELGRQIAVDEDLLRTYS